MKPKILIDGRELVEKRLTWIGIVTEGPTAALDKNDFIKEIRLSTLHIFYVGEPREN